MNNGPWSPEHIYQEIAGYTTSRHRGNFFTYFFYVLGIQTPKDLAK